MTYIVSGGALNSTHSLTLIAFPSFPSMFFPALPPCPSHFAAFQLQSLEFRLFLLASIRRRFRNDPSSVGRSIERYSVSMFDLFTLGNSIICEVLASTLHALLYARRQCTLGCITQRRSQPSAEN